MMPQSSATTITIIIKMTQLPVIDGKAASWRSMTISMELFT
jgi:hypothetical protein